MAKGGQPKGLNIKKGDTVKVIAGRDKGAEGKAIQVPREEQRVVGEGVTRAKRHPKVVNQGGRAGTTGGIITAEAPIHVSNVALVDPETKKPTRVGFRTETIEKDGTRKTIRVRYAKKSGKDL